MADEKSSETAQTDFQFLISAKGRAVLVTLIGEMKNSSLAKLEECQREVLKDGNLNYFVFYFRDVPNVTIDAIPFLTQFQKNIRLKGELRICSLRPELKDKLIKLGVVRSAELVNNLQSAFK